MADENRNTTDGKYDNYATAFRDATGARGVIMIVIDGHLGNGFSVQAPWEDFVKIPEVLRTVATAIEKDAATRAAGGPTLQ